MGFNSGFKGLKKYWILLLSVMSNLKLYVSRRFGHPYNATVCVLFVKKERAGIFKTRRMCG